MKNTKQKITNLLVTMYVLPKEYKDKISTSLDVNPTDEQLENLLNTLQAIKQKQDEIVADEMMKDPEFEKKFFQIFRDVLLEAKQQSEQEDAHALDSMFSS